MNRLSHRLSRPWICRLPCTMAALLALFAAPSIAAAPCADGTLACAASGSLAVGVTQFRAGNQGAAHWAQANVTFYNDGKQPLTLAYVQGSGQLLDENGNRYQVTRDGVRGIGVAERREIDTSFVLQPGERADARFEFSWHRYDPARTGLRFQMAMAIREVTVMPGGQVKLGREHALRWPGLADGAAAVAAPLAAPSTAATTAQAALSGTAAPADEACAGRTACVAAGTFVAEAVRVQKSPRQNNLNLVRVDFRISNRGAEPLILGYQRDSGSLIDDRGERYAVDWRYDQHVAGIGQVEHRKANALFVLEPGASRNFGLVFSRYGPDSGGREFSADIVLAQLELLPGNQVRTAREHALGFTGLSGGPAGAAGGGSPDDVVRAIQSLGELFKKK